MGSPRDGLGRAYPRAILLPLRKEPIVYQVIDAQTGAIVGTYSTRTRARNRADRLDLAYGAIRYYVRAVA